jgi:O-acetyl-ADP-ribose deacetylase (regulator of RNase III)
MIEYTTGDILEAQVDAIVNPVNCVGVMGAGLAKQFRERYPEMFERYKRWCNKGLIELGVYMLYVTEEDRPKSGYPKFIVCFPTKNHWADVSKLEDIEACLDDLQDWVEVRQHSFDEINRIKSIAFPALGCGLGGLDWKDVKPLIDKYFGTPFKNPWDDEVKTIVYEPR